MLPSVAPLKTYWLTPLLVTLNTVCIDSDGKYFIDADTIILPVNVENIFTSNPLFGEIDAVAEPDLILVRSKSLRAETGISNNRSPLPEKDEPEVISIPLAPLTKREPVNCEPLWDDCTLNPKSGEVEAVTLPLAINVATNASGVKAERGILNNFSPLPL